MSNPPSASDSTSPAPVRSSEAFAERSNVSSTTPPSWPTAITPAVLAQRHDAASSSQPLANAMGHEKSPAYRNGSSFRDESEGSNANTPRLPPTMNSKNDLDGIPAGAETTLDGPGTSSAQSTSESTPTPNEYITLPVEPSNRPPILTSISDPGPPAVVRAQGPHEASIHPSETVRSDQTSPSAKARKATSFAPAEILASQHHTRTTSQGVPNSPGMSDVPEQERRQDHNGTTSDVPSRARDEAFSEKRHRSSSRSSAGRVEQRIEATMAEAEPSSNARSRKASHVLGLFKENTAAPEMKKSTDRSKKPSDNAIDESVARTIRELSSSPGEFTKGPNADWSRSESSIVMADGNSSSRRPEAQRPGNGVNSELLQQPSKTAPASRSDPAQLREPQSVDAAREATTIAGKAPLQRGDSTTKVKLPTRLLEEIRGFHNLAAPVHDRFRSTQPRSDEPKLGPPNIETHIERGDEQFSEKDERVAASTTISGSQSQDEDESDKEQISSALYYPHQAPSPDALEDVKISDSRRAKDAQQEFEMPLPEPAIANNGDDELPSEDVDIALQSHNKSRYLHGDLQRAKSTPGDVDYGKFIDGGLSSASESEYDSVDENISSVLNEDSSLTDDGDVTPKASPVPRKPFLLSRSRKKNRTPAAPLGAVELKPYNHQVGGHTTVFRFSKRAVCKQLSSRENEFYEEVEHQHPELLKFLPRYDDPLSGTKACYCSPSNHFHRP